MRGDNPMTRREGGNPHRRPRTRTWAVAAVAATLALGACNAFDRLLEVDTPSQIPLEVLNDPVMATLLVNGVMADFECAFGAYTVLGGILGNELIETSPTANRWPYDRRAVLSSDALYGTFGCAAIGVYTPLSTARWTADRVMGQLEGWTDAQMAQGVNRSLLLATAAAYSGYAHVIMGEGFCSAAFDLGPEIQSQGIFARAEERFTRAIQAANAVQGTATQNAAAASIRNMAHVGRARARLNQSGQTPAKLGEAAADAALVPDGFIRNATASAVESRRENRVVRQNGPLSNVTSVDPRYHNLTVGGVPDTRVVVVNGNRVAPNDVIQVWEQRKYTALNSPIPLATWREARLIRAEAAARAGEAEVATGHINALRTAAGLPQYGGGTAAAVLEQVIEERRRELFLESHNFFDIRRLNLPLDPAPGTTFRKGGQYGDTRCLPLPDVERNNNPNIA
jgi:starch-binding outer membrane protein, SusD/RagB family